MLNEDRIKLMTKLAIYEEKEGKEHIKVGSYYKNDYLSIHLIWTGITTTIAYALIVLLWVGYKIEYFMENIHKMNLPALGRGILLGYILFLIAFLVIAYFIYSRRYQRAKRSLKKYNNQLRTLDKMYVSEDKNR